MLLRSPTLALAAGLLTVLVALLTPVVLPTSVTTPAVAASTNHAGVVIDTGGASRSYCVTFDQDQIDGIALLRLADQQVGGVDPVFSQTSIGTAVCSLRGTGCPADDCFCDPNEYWNYANGNGAGGWTRAQRGAQQRTITDGDVDGWAWGAEGATPPSTTFDAVCPDTTSAPSTPPSSPAPPPPSHPSTPPATTSAPPSSPSPPSTSPSPTPATSTPPPSPTAPTITPTASTASTSPTPRPTASPAPLAAPSAAPAGDAAGGDTGGAPWGLVLFAAVFVGLGTATWLARRRRG